VPSKASRVRKYDNVFQKKEKTRKENERKDDVFESLVCLHKCLFIHVLTSSNLKHIYMVSLIERPDSLLSESVPHG